MAGDRELGEQFMAVATPRVWPEKLDPDAIREIRAMKERAEEITERKGISDRELKRGRGGIRDIEFAVQLLQLVHGREDRSVRSPTTLDALHELADGGYIERADADRLDRAYQFLRTVEHRLQLYDEQQTHLIPSDEHARVRLARCSATATAPSAPRSGSRPSTATISARCAASTSASSSRRCSTRSRGPGRCHPRRPRSGWRRSASPTSSARAPRCGSSPPASPGAPG